MTEQNQKRDTWSLEWRLECEARYLLAFDPYRRERELNAPGRANRRELLKQIMDRLIQENPNIMPAKARLQMMVAKNSRKRNNYAYAKQDTFDYEKP